MADDLLDFLPLYPGEDEETILARMRDDANEGLDPEEDADAWVDTREGSHWYVSVMPGVREFARIYDLMGTEVVSAGMPVWAWADYLDDHAEVQDIVRLAATRAGGTLRFEGPEGTVIAPGTVVGVEPVEPDADVPEFATSIGGVIPAPVAPATSGVLLLPATSTEAGVAGNVGANAVVVPATPLPAGVEVTNPEPMRGGTEPETDEALRERVLAAYVPAGSGNRRDYERWARAWEGVGRVTVIPLWNGPGTVKVIVTTASGDPVSPETVAALQADLDPQAGTGDGRAPIGATVTVTTATARPIDLAATIEFEAGYSLDGAGGSIALAEDITTALREYVERVESGGEVVVSQLVRAIAGVTGVHDVRIDSLEGVTPPVNVAIDDDPAEAPQLGNVALVAGAL